MPAGRPSLYRPEYAEMAKKFCMLGADNAKLAQMFEVGKATIDKWIREIPEFSCSVKEGRDYADANVAASLYHRAIGYSHHEDKIFNNGGEALVVPTEKRYPPDPAAAIFWLKNRQRAKWRDKQEHDLNHGVQDSLAALLSEIPNPLRVPDE